MEQLIFDTLGKIANEGFDDDTIESSLNFIEFHVSFTLTGFIFFNLHINACFRMDTIYSFVKTNQMGILKD